MNLLERARPVSVAAAVCAGATVTYSLVLAAPPVGFESVLGGGQTDYAKAPQWLSTIAALPLQQYVWSARLALVLAWSTWVLTVFLAYRTPQLSRKSVLLSCVVLSIALALAAPVSLGLDVFAYISYGRVSYVHGLNPYEHGRSALEALGDPSAEFLHWPVMLPYGPLWPALVNVFGPMAASVGGMHGEFLLHKVLAGVGHVIATYCVGRVAEVRTPGLGPATMLAVGLNPLLLFTGPICGHNDAIAVGLLAWAASQTAFGRTNIGDVLVGLAIATKTTAMGIVPLLLVDRWKQAKHNRRWQSVSTSIVLVLAPVLLLCSFFGGPQVLFNQVSARVSIARPAGSQLAGAVILLASYLWGLRIVWRSADSQHAIWFTAWVGVAAAIMLTGTAFRFPWYLTWAVVPAFAGWTERDRILITCTSVCAILMMWLDTMTAR